MKKGPQQSEVKWEGGTVQTVPNDHLDLAIPDFLRIPQAERDEAWVRNPPTAGSFAQIKETRNEDEATRLFREQVEAEKLAKKNRSLRKLKESKEKVKVDHETQRWDPGKGRFVDDPVGIARKKARLAASGLVVKETEDKPPRSSQSGPRPPRAAKGEAIVRDPALKIEPPLPDKGKRREVALMCLGGAALADVAKKLECSEGSVRSHLTDLHQKHGFGYRLHEGKATLIAPKGWVKP
jgi:hypothetical protein